MPKKKVADETVDRIDCRGYQVMIWSGGTIYAIANCKIDSDGSSTAYEGFGGFASSAHIRAGEKWRTDKWGGLFDEVGRKLCAE